jgi:hypothetical protein
VLSLRQREHLRRQYQPERVRVLFVGESPPASGRFFYRRDSGLYRAMREAFQAVDPSISEESFLEKFRDSRCYFIDLCSKPVDRLDAKSRRDTCAGSEASLSRTIARLHPVVIATVVRSIEGNVIQAAARANWNGLMVQLPYPGRWAHLRRAFLEALAPIVVRQTSKTTERHNAYSGDLR